MGTMNTFPKLALIAAVVAANEMEEEENLHNHFVAKKYTRAYKFGTGWCGHAGAYTQYADLNGEGRADQTCSDHQGRHWHRMAYGNGSFAGTVYSSQITGWCQGATAWTRFADLTGDKKAEMLCDAPKGQHWAMYGHGGHWNKAHTKYHSKGWCGHAGSWTTWADINGDGKKDITCNDRLGRHWSRLSRGYSWGPSLYHGANWCKGGVTRYSNFWYDTVHPKAEDMICDYQKMHFIRPSLGNGQFHKHTWKTLNNWCHMYFTQYADVNGNGVDDVICSWKGNHWLLAH